MGGFDFFLSSVKVAVLVHTFVGNKFVGYLSGSLLAGMAPGGGGGWGGALLPPA